MTLSSDEAGLQKEVALSGVSYLPHIQVMAFCLLPTTAEVMEQVSQDRHFSKVDMRVQMGGIEAAVEHFGATQSPHLLLVEAQGGRDEIVQQLERLANVCEPETRVIVIGGFNDIALYRELMRFGVSEYLVPPLSVFQIVETTEALYRPSKKNFSGRVYSFFGVKGGVGSSLLAHNVAHHLATQFDRETLLADLDLAFGTLSLNFDLEATQTIFEALSQSDRVDGAFLDRLLTKVGSHLSLLPSPGALDRDLLIQSSAIERVLEVMREQIPLIVLDLPSVFLPWSKQVLLHSDEVVLVVTPEITSLRNTRNILEFLKASRPNDPPPRLILNQTGVPKRVEIPTEEFQKSLKIDFDLVLPFEPELFGQASTNGQMLEQVKADSPVVQSISSFSASLIGQKPSNHTEKESFFEGIYRKWLGR